MPFNDDHVNWTVFLFKSGSEMLMKLTEKQWNLINDMALRIHMIDDIDEMRRDFMSILPTLIDFDEASFYVAKDGDTYANPMGVNLSKEDLEYYVTHFSEIDPIKPLIGIFAAGDEAIRISDYVVVDDMENSDYYRMVLKPRNIKHSLFMPFVVKDKWLGSVTLFRRSDKPDFIDMDVYIANILKKHLQARFWHEDHLGGSNKESADKYGSEKMMQMAKTYDLTHRECEVIELWAKGLTDPEICDRLSISKNTLKKHISNIFGKLEISNRVELLKLMDK